MTRVLSETARVGGYTLMEMILVLGIIAILLFGNRLPEVAKSTHYHAQYVRPNWIREMRRNFKAGLHLFYRPYNWGDGSDEPGWVKPIQTAAKKN